MLSPPPFSWSLAGLLGCALLIGSAASTAPASPLREPKGVATRMPKRADTARDVTTTSSLRGADRSECFKARRKLWVEEDGWVVRRVTVCEPSTADRGRR